MCAKKTSMDLSELTYETAKALEGTAFRVELPDGTGVPMTLHEVLRYETRQRRRSRGTPPRREPFSLYFVGPVNPILPQAMYTFRADTADVRAAVHRSRRSGRRRDGIRGGLHLALTVHRQLGPPLHAGDRRRSCRRGEIRGGRTDAAPGCRAPHESSRAFASCGPLPESLPSASARCRGRDTPAAARYR